MAGRPEAQRPLAAGRGIRQLPAHQRLRRDPAAAGVLPAADEVHGRPQPDLQQLLWGLVQPLNRKRPKSAQPRQGWGQEPKRPLWCTLPADRGPTIHPEGHLSLPELGQPAPGEVLHALGAGPLPPTHDDAVVPVLLRVQRLPALHS